MDLILKGRNPTADGVFGMMCRADTGEQIAVTLEHAYVMADNSWGAKVAAGTYVCQRHPPNRLPYETFELQNVPDFQGQPVTGILIHVGNYNRDSEGCILVGESCSAAMILSSTSAFNSFMGLQQGVDSFTLTIE